MRARFFNRITDFLAPPCALVRYFEPIVDKLIIKIRPCDRLKPAPLHFSP